MRTCAACRTSGQADSAAFCFGCGSAMTAPGCGSCGGNLPPGARFCPDCGASSGPAGSVLAAASPPASTGTARKITSVLFGDLVGFTTLSESRDPEEVRELLTAYFDECRAIVLRYGGELEKFIGDAVMAVWGLPVTREDDAERAVRAGIELVEGVAALGDRIGMPGLALRVGITTAEVAVTIGATGQGMVAGDPVNTAARIQSAAEPGEVWVDETTRSFTSSAIAYDDAGAHAMKGKAESVQLWAVRAVVAGSGGERHDLLESALVGRDRELRLVKEVFHRVEESLRPGLLVIDGEPGTGKSRLSWEFEKYVDGFEAGVLWHRGRCLSYGEGVAYYALAEAVRSRLSVLAGAEASAALETRDLLRYALAACVPDEAEREWIEARLGALLGVETGGSFAREDLFVAWTAFFKLVGLPGTATDRPQPVVLVLDDAQYADEGLLAFLEHLLAAADYPVFVLVLARPELLADHPALVGNRRVTVIHLEALSVSDMTRLLDGLVHGVPDAIRTELVTRAEGIPLYAIETVRSMVDQDLVVNRDGRHVLRDADTVDLSALTAPASLQALIAARLDTLPPEERRVVDQASVLGLVFTESGISALCDTPDLERVLAGLIRREVLRRDTGRLSSDFGSYRFVQGAVRQVAYGMLSRRDRKGTHLRVAQALGVELAARDDAYELAPIIAQHYLDAIDAVPHDPDVPELIRAASDHLERAADRAAALGAPAEAAAHLAMALSRCEPDHRQVVQGRLARQLRLAGAHAEAVEHATEALTGYRTSGDVVAAAPIAEDLVLSLVYGEIDLARAEKVAREQLELLPDSPEALEAKAALVTTLAAVLIRAGGSDEFGSLAAESLRLAELIGDPRQIADSWITYAISCMSNGLPHLGVTLLERAADVAGEHRAHRVRGIALVNLAAFTTYDDLPTALRHARAAVAAGRELGEEYMVAAAQANLAQILMLAGEWEEARAIAEAEEVATVMRFESDLLLRGMANARSLEWPSVSETGAEDPKSIEDSGTRALYYLDLALEAAGTRGPDAVTLALECLRTPSAVDELWTNWVLAANLVRTLGDAAAINEMLNILDVRGGPFPAGVRAQRFRLQAVAGLEDSSSPEVVEKAFRAALDAAREWGSPVQDAHIAADLGRWLRDQGRHDEAAVLLDQAREIYARLDAQGWLAGIDGPG